MCATTTGDAVDGENHPGDWGCSLDFKEPQNNYDC